MGQQTFAEILEEATTRCRTMDAPLADRLQAFADVVRGLNADFAGIVDRMVDRLTRAGAGAGAPRVGDPMPHFLLPDQTGHLFDLDQVLKKGPAVIAFHRGHWCPYCRINAEGLARIEPEIAAAGASLVVITPEVQRFAVELKSDAGARYPILSDIDSGYALLTGVAIWINGEKRAAMVASGWDISEFNASGSWMLPIPATFVVGQDGLVKARYVDPDYRRRMAVEEILAAIRAVA